MKFQAGRVPALNRRHFVGSVRESFRENSAIDPMTKRASKTAAEILAELNADPGFVARQREQEESSSRMAAELSREAAPVIAALRGVGIDIESLRDLSASALAHPMTIPILLNHLQRPYSPRLREGIARALAVPDAITIWDSLLRVFEDEANTSVIDVKWAIGCAIASAATDAVIGDLIRLLHDRRHGAHRLAFISALARSADPRARQAMMETATDPDLALELERALGRPRTNASRSTAAGAAHNDLVEASTSFDADQIAAFLERVAGLVHGFDQKNIENVIRSVGELDVDDTCELAFTVMHADRMVPMRIHIFMDDVDSPSVYFFTAPSLARDIRQAMEDFFDERGM